jgi:hypothetical protein
MPAKYGMLLACAALAQRGGVIASSRTISLRAAATDLLLYAYAALADIDDSELRLRFE